jgi:hypothetical protein
MVALLFVKWVAVKACPEKRALLATRISNIDSEINVSLMRRPETQSANGLLKLFFNNR